MAAEITFEDLNNIEYAKAWEYQESCMQKIISAKKDHKDTSYLNRFLFCEHPHVYTLGKSGHQENLLINPEFLKSINATYYKIDRGGDITYHGPGQIVGYPIIDLEAFESGVKSYIHHLEECIILTLNDFKISASRLSGSTGVWLDVDIPGKSRKICAIGVRVSRYVTMHGFALNVNTDLKYFNYINPCGFTDKGVTSMEKELGKKIDLHHVKYSLELHFCNLFKIKERVKNL